MHSKQGKKATIPHHLHKLQHTSLQTHKKTKNHTIHKSLTIKCLLNYAKKSLIFLPKYLVDIRKSTNFAHAIQQQWCHSSVGRAKD